MWTSLKVCLIELKFQDNDFIAFILPMSSNKNKPVKLLALGEILMI